jgi:predicted flavoprotein YhiN
MKAAPLLRAWLHRLRAAGVRFHVRHRWRAGPRMGAELRFATPAGEEKVGAGATVLALGGGSWAKLGSDGAWVPLLAARGVKVAACARPTAASTWPGASTCGSALPERR